MSRNISSCKFETLISIPYLNGIILFISQPKEPTMSRIAIGKLCLAAASLILSLASNGCKSDSTSTQITITPITDNLFPLVSGHQYTYTGYLVDTNQVDVPKPGIPPGLYSTTWTVLPGPSGTWLIKDSTRVAGTSTVRFLLIRKDTTTGDFDFRQTLGPFFRRFGVTYSDTAIWVKVARPSMGIGNVWSAFDTTVTGTIPGVGSAAVRIQIFGKIEGLVTVIDSSSGHVSHQCYKARTWRDISVSGVPVQSDATTAYLWLEKDLGPVQVNIAGDSENYGHFRVLKSRNF
jgi:hypothetical protein